MTINDLLKMPKGFSIEEYQELLDQKNKLFVKCQNLSNKIEIEKDSLAVLKDEKNSYRFLNHKKLLRKYLKQREVCLQKYNQIERRLH